METPGKFVSVRFGNVLDRAARCCTAFRADRPGGPITVTDPEVTRFFMTIQEAVRAGDPGRGDRRRRGGPRPRHG